jgi:hypothetical protein
MPNIVTSAPMPTIVSVSVVSTILCGSYPGPSLYNPVQTCCVLEPVQVDSALANLRDSTHSDSDWTGWIIDVAYVLLFSFLIFYCGLGSNAKANLAVLWSYRICWVFCLSLIMFIAHAVLYSILYPFPYNGSLMIKSFRCISDRWNLISDSRGEAILQKMHWMHGSPSKV